MNIQVLTLGDKRLGTKATDKTEAVWPDLDVMGNPYTRPATTYGLPGKRHFVVLPVGFLPEHYELIRFESKPTAKTQEG